MKTKILLLVSLLGFALVALAQTNLPPDAPLPSTSHEFWVYGIAIITPLLVGLIRKIVPQLPTWMLPVSTPFVGMALGAGLKALGASHLGWIDMAQAGALAVFVRESFNQVVSQRMGTASKPQ